MLHTIDDQLYYEFLRISYTESCISVSMVNDKNNDFSFLTVIRETRDFCLLQLLSPLMLQITINPVWISDPIKALSLP